ncbi:MAG: FliH/SctL family protein [Bryobacteraceae bacterium]|jgi:flagellar assembly protein FliH
MGRIIKQPGSFRTFDWSAGAPRELPPGSPLSSAPIQTRQHDEEQLRQAVQRGYLQGEAAARAALEEPAKAAHAELLRAIAGLAEMRAVIYKEAQADLLRLSMAIARRIVHRELLVSPDILQSIVSVVLDKLDRQEVHRVRVHPAMAARLDEGLKSLSHQRPIVVAGDPTLSVGACIFETGRGNVDASIDSQLGEIERGLADRLET